MRPEGIFFNGLNNNVPLTHSHSIYIIMCITKTCVFMTLAAIIMVQIQSSRSSLNTSNKDNIQQFPQKSPKLNMFIIT
jgi:hypothetical protein